MNETISKSKVCEILADMYPTDGEKVVDVAKIDKAYEAIQQLPSVQPDLAIPLSWIEKHVEWLKSLDNEFANLTASNISTTVEKWKSEYEKQ